MKNTMLTTCAAVVLTGCASYSAKPIDSRHEASSVIEQREADGLFLAAKDLSSPRLSLQFFDRDLVGYGYVPVLLLLELDRDSENVFDIRREDLQVCLRDGQRLLAADPSTVADGVSFSHLRSAFGFFFIFPGFFLASSVNHANSQLELDYQAKAPPSVRINPNRRSFRSVVFFTIPPESRDTFTMEDAFLELKVHKQGQGGSLGETLEFPVHFTK